MWSRYSFPFSSPVTIELLKVVSGHEFGDQEELALSGPSYLSGTSPSPPSPSVLFGNCSPQAPKLKRANLRKVSDVLMLYTVNQRNILYSSIHGYQTFFVSMAA